MELYLINAFTKNALGGNPAGVVLNADEYTEDQMKSIAKKVGFSETAFVMKSKVADFKVRFFTPNNEVDLCGHATIATFSLLKQLKVVSEGEYTQETKAGILKLKLDSETVYMEQLNPIEYEIIQDSEISYSLTLEKEKIYEPISIYSTGLKDIIIRVENFDVLDKIDPKFDIIKSVSEKYGVVGYHVFAIEDKEKIRARNFAPLYAVNEESATGTATGALMGYLIKNKLVEFKDGINEFTFEQGYSMNRPSEIKALCNIKDNKINSIYVGGKCSSMKRQYIK